MRLVLFLVMSMLGLACSLSRVSRNAALRRRVEPRALLAVGWKPSPAPLQLQKVIDWVSPPAGEKTLDEQTHKAYAGLKRAVSNAIVTNWHRKSMLQDLVRFGDAWVAMHNIEHVRIPKLVENQNFHMVEGCTSAVAIGIIHHERQSHCSVIGKSDSRVIQGLLAVICDVSASSRTSFLSTPHPPLDSFQSPLFCIIEPSLLTPRRTFPRAGICSTMIFVLGIDSVHILRRGDRLSQQGTAGIGFAH